MSWRTKYQEKDDHDQARPCASCKVQVAVRWCSGLQHDIVEAIFSLRAKVGFCVKRAVCAPSAAGADGRKRQDRKGILHLRHGPSEAVIIVRPAIWPIDEPVFKGKTVH
jgi:hypothetical protein